ncbi:hypothetical protein SAMN04488505_101938 [Chitinophaga rupis]|uniref:Outer membrane protein beta-barrel domain-containing protein n=2 Tax=Chitinophaga rupis TaxID=573321 RepID=A0A1H7K4T7_9BACT|nr:hypothetical protein SAMN04488505_101938 [Chitinophaga rupis]
MSDAFDNKFRERLSEENFPFDPDAWKKMERKLDALDNDTNRKPFWWWLAPLVLILLGTGAFIWWRNSTTTTTSPVVETTKTTEQATTTSPADSVLTSNEKIVAPNDNNSAVVPPVSKTPSASSDVTTLTPARNNNSTPANASVNKPGQNKYNTTGKGFAADRLANKQRTKNTSPVADQSEQPLSNSNDVTGTDVSNAPAPVNKNTSGLAEENEVLRLLNTHYFTNPAVSAKLNRSGHLPIKEIAEKTEKKKNTVPSRKGFSVGLMLGPVFNVAPSLEYGKFGLDGGILVNYHINNRWSFTTGAVYSDKPYGGTRKDYGVIKTWSYPMNTVKRIDANCKVLDVPININYTFMDRPKYTLTATVGLSSYFMLKEEYTYKRDYMTDWNKSLSNENQHYLSVLNLAFTYQLPLNSHMSLGIQPFVKVPLGDIGYGQVKLYSTGVAVQLNFNQFRRKQ